MGRKDQERRRRLQQQRQEKPPPEPGKAEPEKPTWERRLEERALRERWPMPPELRIKALTGLIQIIDWKGETPDESPPSHRDVNSAVKTLLMVDRLNIEQEKLAIAASAAVTETEAARPAADPIDDAKYAWYDESCPCGLPAGECKEHPRANSAQRPPDGEWTKWFMMGGRGSGKTRAGAEYVRHQVENGLWKRIALVAPTAADVRDVMVQGVSGIMAISRPDFMPVYQPSIRRLTWPNGASATCFSADEPDRLRGPQHDGAWADEPGAWRRGEAAWDNLMLGLRLGDNPRALLTSTPRSIKLIKNLVADPKVIFSRCTTYDNRMHLAPSFFSEIVAKYEGTRLGEQEINGQLIDIAEGAWFPMFGVNRHVSVSAEFNPRLPIRCAIDAGASRYTGAVYFQLWRERELEWPKVNIFGEYLAVDVMSAENAKAILAKCIELTGRGPDLVRLDPAANQRTSLGPVAYNEYAIVFGAKITARWPMHRVIDGLNQLELMLGVAPKEPSITIHPRCKATIAAFQNYRRKQQGGEYLDEPLDDDHPHEDMMDSVRGGIRDAMPEGRTPPSGMRSVHAGNV